MTIEKEIRDMGCGWVSLKGFAICIQTTDEGIVVDIYDEAKLDRGEVDDALLGSTYAYSSELNEEGDDE